MQTSYQLNSKRALRIENLPKSIEYYADDDSYLLGLVIKFDCRIFQTRLIDGQGRGIERHLAFNASGKQTASPKRTTGHQMTCTIGFRRGIPHSHLQVT